MDLGKPGLPRGAPRRTSANPESVWEHGYPIPRSSSLHLHGGLGPLMLGKTPGSPRFPLKGSFKGDIDMGIDVDVDIDHQETY